MTFQDNQSMGNFPEWDDFTGPWGQFGRSGAIPQLNSGAGAGPSDNPVIPTPGSGGPMLKTSAPDMPSGASSFKPTPTSGFTQPGRGMGPTSYEDGGAIPDPDQEDQSGMPGNDPASVVDQVFGYLRKKYGVTGDTKDNGTAIPDDGSKSYADGGAVDDDDQDVTGAVTAQPDPDQASGDDGVTPREKAGGAPGGAIPDNQQGQPVPGGEDHSIGSSPLGKSLKRLLAYVQGDGAADPQTAEATKQAVDPTTSDMPASERNQKAIAYAATKQGMEAGAAQLQHDRKKYNAWRGAAAVAYDNDNQQQVGEYLSKAFDHMPDGMQVIVQPRGDGYLATLAQNGKTLDQVPLSQGAVEQLVKTKAGMFDGVYEKGAQQIFRSLADNASAPTEKQAFLDRYPVYKAPAGLDQTKWEQAGGEFPWASQDTQRRQRAAQLGEKEQEQNIEEKKVDATAANTAARTKNQTDKNQIERDKLSARERFDEQKKVIDWIKATVPQFDATPQNIQKAMEAARKFGIIGGGAPQTRPAAQETTPTKRPAGAAFRGEDGNYYDKNGNLVK